MLEGKSVSLASLAVNPVNWQYLWNPFRPSWGEPYTEVVARVQAGHRPGEGSRPAARRRSASATSCRSGSAASPPSTGACGTTRSQRQCALGSVTSLTFDGDQLTGVSYAVPPRRQVADPDRAQ